MDFNNLIKHNIRLEINKMKEEGRFHNLDLVSNHPLFSFNKFLNCTVPKYELKENKLSTNSKTFNKQVSISFKIIEEDSDTEDGLTYRSDTVVSTDFSFVGLEKVNFVHDYTFSVICDNTDFELRTWETYPDNKDDNTPDYCYVEDNDFIVIEFTTNGGQNNDKGMRRDILHKLEKYSEPLLNRLLKKREQSETINAWLFVINVSQNSIYLNFDLQVGSRQIIHELCLRYVLARDIECDLIKSGKLPSRTSEEMSLDMKALTNMFTRIKFWKTDPEEPLTGCLTEQELDKFVNPDPAALNKRLRRTERMIREIRNKASRKNLELSNFSQTLRNRDKKEDIIKPNLESYNRLVATEQDIKLNSENCYSEVESYEIKQSNSTFRRDIKTVCPFPFVILDRNNDYNMPGPISINGQISSLQGAFYEKENATGAVWTHVLEQIRFYNAVDDDESLEDQIFRACNPVSTNDVNFRNKRHRIQVVNDDVSQIELAKRGIYKKTLNMNNEVRAYIHEKSKPFSITTSTIDIEQFITDPELALFTDTEEIHFVTSEVKKLLIDSIKLHIPESDSKVYDNLVTKILGLPIMRWAKLVADMALEIDISMKQHVGKNQFIVKRVKDHNMFLLLRPTNQDGFINYSLLWHDDDTFLSRDSSIFPTIHKYGEYNYTDFRSLTADKLSNQVSMESIIFNQIVFWLNEYKVNVLDDNLFKNHDLTNVKQAYSMILASTLIASEDKKQTEQVLTNIRYVYMEGFVSFPRMPKPQKMIKKLPDVLRSRLTIYFVKKTLELMKYICDGGHFYRTIRMDELDMPETYRTNMINYITKEKTEDLNLIINLMYIGYLNNKAELMQGNQLNTLYKKIIEMEKLFTDDIKKTIGKVDVENPKKLEELKRHEYSTDMLYFGCLQASAKLKNNKGQTFRQQVEESFLRKLSLTNVLNTFGTLKSSSTFDSQNDFHYEIKETYELLTKEKKAILKKENMKPNRSKVIIEALDYLEKYPDLWNLVPVCLEELMEKNRLDVDLFDKAQHGGIREIFILNFSSRVCQYVLESMSRSLCECFPMEMMTHPRNKDILVGTHNQASQEMFKGKSSLTLSSSDDAEKWNQAHYVGKFGQMLAFFYPKYMWPFISNTLSLWFVRRIKIDPRLIEIMEKHEDLEVEDECFQELYDIYKGRRPTTSWYTGNKRRFINIQSGFMQGILHYTSSLFHVISLECTNTLSLAVIKTFLDKMNLREHSFVITFMVSSDDSSMMLSLPAYSVKVAQFMSLCASMCFDIKTFVGESLGIYLSVKSTQNTMFCMEFNSIFNFQESRYHAYIKQVMAVHLLSEKESLIARQEESSNALTSIVENGGSFLLASLCQFSQGLMHYRFLGSSVLPIVTNLIADKLLELRDPSVGYFLMDNPLISGITGFKYNMWNLIETDSSMSTFFKFILDNALAKEATESLTSKQLTLHTTSSGLFTNQLIIPYGENRKLRSVQEKLNIDDSIYEQVNADPSVLYFKPRSSESIVLLAKLKFLSPGVVESFSRGVGMAKLMAHSVYITTNAILDESANFYAVKDTTKKVKTSMTKRLLENIEVMNDLEISLNNEEKTALFPLHDEYYSLKANAAMLRLRDLQIKIKRTKNVKSTIVIHEADPILLPTNQIIAWKWFTKSTNLSRSVMEELWSRLKNHFKWLRENYNETLAISPFNNHYQILNFFSRIDATSRRIHLLGAPLGYGSAHSNLITVACRNVWSGHEISLVKDEKEYNLSQEFKCIRHCLYMISRTPLTLKKREEKLCEILLNSKSFSVESNTVNSAKYNLCMIQKTIKNCSLRNSPDKFIKPQSIKPQIPTFRSLILEGRLMKNILMEIQTSRFGIIGSFVLCQNYRVVNGRSEYYGPGTWVGKINEVSVRINLNSREENGKTESYVESMIVNKPKLSNNFFQSLRMLCTEMHVFNTHSVHQNLPKLLTKMHNFMESSKGTSIYYDSEMSTLFDVGSESFIKVTYESGSKSLKLKLGNKYMSIKGEREDAFTILSYSLRSRDYDLSVSDLYLSKLNLGRFLETWVTDKPMKEEDIFKLVEKLKANDSTLKTMGFDIEDLRSWIKDCFISACIKSGLILNKHIKNLNESSMNKTSFIPDYCKRTAGEILEDLTDELCDLLGDLDDSYQFTEDILMEPKSNNIIESEHIEDLVDQDNEEEYVDVMNTLLLETVEYQDKEISVDVRNNNNSFIYAVRRLELELGRYSLTQFLSFKVVTNNVTEDKMKLLTFILQSKEEDYTHLKMSKLEDPSTSFDDDFV
ncbi:RNA-dependent RNA polymerase [Pidgey virus]|uniref:RNA-directed RNA polymerase L n=1 Tax=Pidgey virus TaxID=1911436 RepID=A0A2Z2CF66_9VIRU|nr:RNA-dependent RNA polymerase [Pidgey virus]AOX47534.1 RNA-dependent RNA polymerase [Pidgey virus]